MKTLEGREITGKISLQIIFKDIHIFGQDVVLTSEKLGYKLLRKSFLEILKSLKDHPLEERQICNGQPQTGESLNPSLTQGEANA